MSSGRIQRGPLPVVAYPMLVDIEFAGSEGIPLWNPLYLNHWLHFVKRIGSAFPSFVLQKQSSTLKGGIGRVMVTSDNVCVHVFFSRSAPCPEFGPSPLSSLSKPLGLRFWGSGTETGATSFSAEVAFEARSLPTDKLRPAYAIINGLVYVIQVCVWIYLGIDENHTAEAVAKLFFAVVSFFAALGFLVYGGRLFFMLRRFPIESKGRRKKLNEHEVNFTIFNKVPMN
eukprot:Gb_13785 [translate_table: standard]